MGYAARSKLRTAFEIMDWHLSTPDRDLEITISVAEGREPEVIIKRGSNVGYVDRLVSEIAERLGLVKGWPRFFYEIVPPGSVIKGRSLTLDRMSDANVGGDLVDQVGWIACPACGELLG
jgi:hypothetical protein